MGSQVASSWRSMMPARVHVVHRDNAHGTTRRHEARIYCVKSRDRGGQVKKEDGEAGARRNKDAARLGTLPTQKCMMSLQRSGSGR
jgi:hypothetical protein